MKPTIRLQKILSYILLPVMVLFTFQAAFGNNYECQITNYDTQQSINRGQQHSLTINNSQLTINTNPFKYSGYYSDSESRLYYLKARYYSPELMRFINRDTYDLSNRYAYGNGDPINNVDSTGHFSLPNYINYALGAIGVAGAIATAFLTAGSGACFALALSSAISGSASLGTQIASDNTSGKTSIKLSYASAATGAAGIVGDIIDLTCVTRIASNAAKESSMIESSLSESAKLYDGGSSKLEQLHSLISGGKYNQYSDMDLTLNTHGSYAKMYKFDSKITSYGGSIVNQLNRETGGTTNILTHGFFNKGKLDIFEEFGISKMDSVFDTFDVAGGEMSDKFATIERLQKEDNVPALLMDNDQSYMDNVARKTSMDLYFYNPVTDRCYKKAAEAEEWMELFSSE
jgi:RHS repeat-associated protein